MTKIEIINEMYDVVNNNADVFQYADKWLINVYAEYIKTTKKATLEQYLAKLNAMVEEAKKVETVETEVENNTEKNIENMTKNEIINEIKKFICNVDYFHYFKFMEGENKTKTPLNCALIGDDGIMYYRYFDDSDRIHFKKLKNCTKAELIAIDGVCKLYIDHMNSKLSEVA